MAAASGRERDDLARLYRASLEFNSTLDPDELLPRVFDRVIDALDAEAGSIWLKDGERVVCELGRAEERRVGKEVGPRWGAGDAGKRALEGTVHWSGLLLVVISVQ